MGTEQSYNCSTLRIMASQNQAHLHATFSLSEREHGSTQQRLSLDNLYIVLPEQLNHTHRAAQPAQPVKTNNTSNVACDEKEPSILTSDDEDDDEVVDGPLEFTWNPHPSTPQSSRNKSAPSAPIKASRAPIFSVDTFNSLDFKNKRVSSAPIKASHVSYSSNKDHDVKEQQLFNVLVKRFGLTLGQDSSSRSCSLEVTLNDFKKFCISSFTPEFAAKSMKDKMEEYLDHHVNPPVVRLEEYEDLRRKRLFQKIFTEQNEGAGWSHEYYVLYTEWNKTYVAPANSNRYKKMVQFVKEYKHLF